MPTYTRKSHLDQATVTLGVTAYTHNFKTFNAVIEDQDDAGQGIGERYADPVLGKSKFTFGGQVLRTLTGVRQSMLSFTVFTVGGTSKLGQLESGSMQGTTEIDMGEAGNDQWEYPFAMGTDITINARLKVTNTAAYMSLMTGNAAARNVQVVMTMGNFSITMPAKLSRVTHSTDQGKIQTEEVVLKIKGSSALASTGDPTLASAITGTASIAYSVDTGANVYTSADGCVVTSFGFDFSSGQIIRDNFEFQACGAVVVS